MTIQVQHSQPQIFKQLQAVFPILQWLPQYQWAWLQSDMVAGITLAAFAAPVALAYASLAGLPPQVGLYCSMLAAIAYVPLGTSRQLFIGPMSAVSMMMASSLGAMGIDDPTRYVTLASLTAVLVGVICIVAALLRLGQVANFISGTIITGFKAGAAFQIGSSQIPKLLGLSGGSGNVFERLIHVAQQIPQTNLPSLGLGLAAIALLLLGEALFPQVPISLMVVVLSIGLMSTTHLGDWGIRTLGDIPKGLPTLDIPTATLADLEQLIPLALACFVLSYVQSMAIARTFALEHDYTVRADQELLAIGAANILTGLGHGYPVGGGMSQSTLSDRSGAKSAIASLVAALLIGVVLLFFTQAFHNLPAPILAAIVLVALKSLIKFKEIRYIYTISPLEFRVSLVTFVGVLIFGILNGVLIGILCSLILLLQLASNPNTAVLGRIPGTTKYSDMARHPDNEIIPGVLIYRVDGGIFYFNVDTVQADILQKVQECDRAQKPLTLMLFDLSSVVMIDLAGVKMLRTVNTYLRSQGITLYLMRARGSLRDFLRLAGVEEDICKLERGQSITQTIEAWKTATDTLNTATASTVSGLAAETETLEKRH